MACRARRPAAAGERETSNGVPTRVEARSDAFSDAGSTPAASTAFTLQSDVLTVTVPLTVPCSSPDPSEFAGLAMETRTLRGRARRWSCSFATSAQVSALLPGLVTASPVPSSVRKHQTQKPLSVMRELVRIVVPGGLILDPFAGAGHRHVIDDHHAASDPTRPDPPTAEDTCWSLKSLSSSSAAAAWAAAAG